MTRQTDRSKLTNGDTPTLPTLTTSPSQAASSEPDNLLDSAIRILTACGEAPALVQEVLALQANTAGGEMPEDIVILLLEAAILHHLPDIQNDPRSWAQELVRIAGI